MIEVLPRSPAPEDLDQLALLLVDAVASGAGVSFLRPLPLDDARGWWQCTLDASSPRAVFLVARDGHGVAGTVQLQPSWAPNQPHRADVAKLMVHRRARGLGLGRALVDAIEAHARAAGFTLLTLDTVRGAAAERLYAAAGWQRVGVIPDFALSPDGVLCDTVIFYKRL